MPTYELSVGGKTYEIQADKDLSDADLAKHASGLAPQPGAAGGYPTPKDRDPGAPRPTLKFGDRVAKEWDRWTNPANWEKTTQARDDIGSGLSEIGMAGPSTVARGVTDAALTAGRNTLGTVAGGVAGIGTLAAKSLRALGSDYTMSDALNESADVVNRIRDATSTHPKTPLGRALIAALAAPVNVSGDVAGNVGETIGDVAGNAAAGRTIGEAAPALALGGKALRDWQQTQWSAPEAAEAEAGGISMRDIYRLYKAAKIIRRTMGGP